MTADIVDEIADAISSLKNSENVRELVNKAISKGIPAVEIVQRGLRTGLDSVGKKYEAGEFFLSELLYSGMLTNEALAILEPRLKLEKIQSIGQIVVGTVRGDMHDIGKNIFKMLAQGSGFEVHDLGVDVEAEAFVRKLKETDASILGLSALLTTTIEEMRNVIEKLKVASIRNHVKVILGGNAVTKEFARDIGADGAASDAVEGIELCKRWAGGNV